jgi:hypothetical protein
LQIGTHCNEATGQLAVQQNASSKVTIHLPLGLSITLDKGTRSKGTDVFKVNVPQTTAGPGKSCRVRVDTYAKARCVVTCTIGIALAGLNASLRGNLQMTGTCYVDDKKVSDTFLVEQGDGDRDSKVKAPSGGHEKEADEIPTDQPTEEERAGEEEEPAEDVGEEEVETPGGPTPPEEAEEEQPEDGDGSSSSDGGGSAGGYPPPTAN